MGRKTKKQDEGTRRDGVLTALKQETLEGISAIVFIIVAVFLILARFDKAGFVGVFVYNIFSRLLGVGFYLLPLALIVLGISFLKSLSHNLAWPKITGTFIFLLSGIGLIDLIFGKGGAIGKLVSIPLNKLFDFWVSAIILVGGIVISMLVVFDTSLRVSFIENWLARRREAKEAADDSEEDVDVKIDHSNDEVEEKNTADKKVSSGNKDDEVSVKKTRPKEMEDVQTKKSPGLIFFSKKTDANAQYKIPPLSLLDQDSGKPGTGDIKANANIIKRTLGNFGIHVEMDEVSIGPTVTRYALKPAEGIKLSRIVALQNDLSLALAAHPLRIEAPIPGKSLVGIEIPNTSKTKVGLGTLLKQPEFQESSKPLTIGLGKGVTGHSHFTDLAKAPHMLIAGATGSGKSVTIHTLITSLLFKNSPDMLKFIMIDPKRVELTLYNKIPHLLTPVITDAKKTILSLKWAAKEMDRRYDVLQGHGVRDIGSYHSKILAPAIEKAKKAGPKIEGEPAPELPETMPFIVIVIDELADIMQTYPRELESGIVRLAQMSRAIGIHLIISTQRPSVNVITGLIKANVPTRVALQVASQIDSRTILDQPGAEKLLGQGDMLFLGGDMAQPRRIQSAFISEDEVKGVVKFLVDQYQNEVPENNIDLDGVNERNNIFDSVNSADDDADDDELYGEAKEVVVGAGKASTSFLQRKLGVGYSRAAKLIDLLEEKGVIGPANGSKPRDILGGGSDDARTDDATDDITESDKARQ